MAELLIPALIERLNAQQFTWFTTVRADGMPQPTPVWFIVADGAFWIYSVPTAQKVRNIQHNPHVALSFAFDAEAGAYVVVMGEAAIVEDSPRAIHNAGYLAKYREGIKDIQMEPESMSERFSTLIRVTPVRVREE